MSNPVSSSPSAASQRLACRFDARPLLQLLQELAEQRPIEFPRPELGAAFAVAVRAACCFYPEFLEIERAGASTQFPPQRTPPLAFAALTTPLSWRLMPDYFDLPQAAEASFDLPSVSRPLASVERHSSHNTNDTKDLRWERPFADAPHVLIAAAEPWGLSTVELVRPTGVAAVFVLDSVVEASQVEFHSVLKLSLSLSIARLLMQHVRQLLESPDWLVGL